MRDFFVQSSNSLRRNLHIQQTTKCVVAQDSRIYQELAEINKSLKNRSFLIINAYMRGINFIQIFDIRLFSHAAETR